MSDDEPRGKGAAPAARPGRGVLDVAVERAGHESRTRTSEGSAVGAKSASCLGDDHHARLAIAPRSRECCHLRSTLRGSAADPSTTSRRQGQHFFTDPGSVGPQRGREDRAGADPQPDPVGDGEPLHLRRSLRARTSSRAGPSARSASSRSRSMATAHRPSWASAKSSCARPAPRRRRRRGARPRSRRSRARRAPASARSRRPPPSAA